MNKQLLFTLFASLAFLTACNGGSGSSSGGTAPTSDTYTLQSTVASPSGLYTSFGSNGSSTAYLATTGGFYSITGNTTNNVNNTPNIAVVSGANGTLYYVPANSFDIYNANGSIAYNIGSSSGYITSISPSTSNGSMLYGTSNGNVGLLNNPAGKQINSVGLPSSPILAIGCISNDSCNSGNQGIMTLASIATIIPAFESPVYVSNPSSWNYPTTFYYYNLGSWVQISYNPVVSTANTINYYTIESNPGTMVNPTAYQLSNVNEFVTSVAFNNGNIYVGTNLFNIYASYSYSCNNGQLKNGGCPLTFQGPLNINSTNNAVMPLGWVQNGSIGIVNLAVQSNGSLLAIAEESPTYATVYVSSANTY